MSRLSREKSVSRSHRDRGLIRRDRSHSAPKSVHFRLEIGRNPRRDRSQPASRSVVLRVEIGPLPPRDRSQPAPRLSCAVHLGRCLRASQWARRSPLVLCNRANEAVGRARGSMMRRWARFSSVLHMGTGPRPLPTLLFRMIPRFPPTPNARKCATPTTRGHAGTSRSGLRLSSPTHTTLSPKSHTGNHQTRRTHPLTPSQTP